MRPKLNLKDKSQMSTPNAYRDKFKSNLIYIFPSVRAKLKKKHYALGYSVFRLEVVPISACLNHCSETFVQGNTRQHISQSTNCELQTENLGFFFKT